LIVCVAASLLTFFFITSDITRRKGMVWSDTLGGVVVGILPAMRCYRRSLSDGLSPEIGG